MTTITTNTLGKMRRWKEPVGLVGILGLVCLFPALTLLAGGDPLPWGPDWLHDDQKWLMVGCGTVIVEAILRLLPTEHRLRMGNKRLTPPLSRGGRTAIRLVLFALAAFWIGTNCLLVGVTLRAIEYAQLKPVSVRKHLMDF